MICHIITLHHFLEYWYICMLTFCTIQTQNHQCRFDWLDRSTCLARANGANDETPNPTTRAPTSHPTTKSPTQNPTTKNPTTKPTQSINVLTDFPTFSPTESEVSTPKPTPRGTPKPTRDCTALWHVVSFYDERIIDFWLALLLYIYIHLNNVSFCPQIYCFFAMTYITA